MIVLPPYLSRDSTRLRGEITQSGREAVPEGGAQECGSHGGDCWCSREWMARTHREARLWATRGATNNRRICDV